MARIIGKRKANISGEGKGRSRKIIIIKGLKWFRIIV